MTFMDVLRKEEEEETVEEEVSSSPIHVDVWDLFDRFAKKSKAVSQQGLEEADEALEELIQLRFKNRPNDRRNDRNATRFGGLPRRIRDPEGGARTRRLATENAKK